MWQKLQTSLKICAKFQTISRHKQIKTLNPRLKFKPFNRGFIKPISNTRQQIKMT